MNIKLPSKVAAAFGRHSEKTAAMYTHLSENNLVDEVIKKVKNTNKIILLYGARQVGKTTFLESVAKDYISLDDFTEARAAQKNPKTFHAYK